MRNSFGRTASFVAAAALAAALLGASAPKAHADAGQGAFRLGADVPVISLQHFPFDFGSATLFQFGLWGAQIARPQLGMSFGYQVIEPLVIGARAGFGVALIDVGSSSTTQGLFALVPFIEYMFGSGNLRPFIGAQAGFQILFPERADAQAWFVGGGLGGVHIFPSESFSISPTLMLDFLYRGDFQRAGFGMSALVTLNGWIS